MKSLTKTAPTILGILVLTSLFGFQFGSMSIQPAEAQTDTPTNDMFGITKIYPTTTNGNTWYMDMTNPTSDPRFDPQTSITQNLDGSWKVKNTKVRMEVFSTTESTFNNTPIPTYSRTQLANNGYMQLPSDWNNFEMTGYVKLNAGTNDDFTWYGRGGKHNDSAGGCEGSSYKGVLDFDGGNRFAKETYHVKYAFTGMKFNSPPLLDQWIGFKYVIYDKPGVNFAKQVQQEIWIDANNNNNWVKVNSYSDDGWGSGATHCGPATADNMPMTWGGPIVTFRVDNSSDFDFKNLSVREIQSIIYPTTGPTTTASPSGGTYTSTQLVTLSTNEAATIYYTLNGSTPTTSSSIYSTPISIPITTTLKFYAVDSDGNTETVRTAIYTINESPGDVIIHMSDTTTSTGQSIYSDRSIHAEYVSPTSQLIGDNIDTIKVKLKKNGSPSGNAEVGVFGADLSTKKLFSTVNVSTLATSYTEYTFSLPSGQSYQIQPDDRIGVKYVGGDGANFISITRDIDPSDPFDGTHSYHTYYTTIWNSFIDRDLYMILQGNSGTVHTDTQKPVITPIGTSKSIPFGSSYTEQGATVTDNDPAYSGAVTVGGDIVNTSVAGNYVITYNAPSDAAGNTSDEKSIIITVEGEIVSDTQKPVITPIGTSKSIPFGSSYTEQGATVTDNDPAYSGAVTVGGDIVNTSVAGNYVITYNAPSDAAGNTPDEKSIIITVEIQGVPIIHMSDTTTSTGQSIYSDRSIHAEYVSPTSQLIGDNIDTIKVKLKKNGSPSGNAEVGVFGADLSTKKLFSTVNVSTLATSYTEYTFSLPSGQSYQIQPDDRIGVKYVGGDSTNYVAITRDIDPSDPFDGTHSYHTYYTTIWNSFIDRDLYMILQGNSGTVHTDTQKPVITPIGTSKSIPFGSSYTEQGATVTDNDPAYSGAVTVGGDIVNTSVAGNYVITYNAPSDAAGNTSDEKSIIITVEGEIVSDTQKPVITPIGTSKSIPFGSSYTEQGATVTDNDPAYSGAVTVGGDIVNTSVAGNYVITYNAPSDAAGNTPDEKSITITVEAHTASLEISFDASNATVCDSNPCPLPLTITSGNDRIIVVVSTVEGTLNLIDSIDVNGRAGQGILVDSQQVGSGSTLQSVEMWRIMDVDILDGINNISVNYENTPSDSGVSLLSFSGVAQQPEEAVASSFVTDDAITSTEINTLTNGALIISGVGHGQTGAVYTSHGLGQSERHNFTIPSAWHAVTTEIKELAGSDIQSHTLSSSVNRQAQVVASFAPVNELLSDTQKPVITPIGTSKSIPFGSSYTEQGATVTDNDPAYSGAVTVGGDIVNTSVAGNYVITYNAPSDAAGNTSDEKSIIITVEGEIVSDTQKPVITPIGTSKSIPFGSSYTEQGAIVTDNDPAYSGAVTVGGDIVNTSVAGNYVITYNAPSDAAGNTPDEKSIMITVTSKNDPPNADAGGPYTGTVKTAISFDGSKSTDPDGDSLIYLWNYGDGNTGTGVNPNYTYDSTGNYLVTLTVDDGHGNTDSATSELTIEANEDDLQNVHVGDLDSKNVGRSSWLWKVTIKIHDENDKPVSDVVVNGTWSGGSNASSSCTTDSKGKCKVFQSTRGDTLTFTVDDISSDFVYIANANHDKDEDSDGTSITFNTDSYDDD